MKKYIFGIIGIVLLSGCAGKTTDPRKGGLFSYNPDAYEKRLSDRENRIDEIERDTSIQKNRGKELEQQYIAEKIK